MQEQKSDENSLLLGRTKKRFREDFEVFRDAFEGPYFHVLDAKSDFLGCFVFSSIWNCFWGGLGGRGGGSAAEAGPIQA